MLITNSIAADLVVLAVTLVAVLATWHLWALYYWQRKGVPTPPTYPLLGTFKDFIVGDKSLGQVVQEAYLDYKKQGKRYFGVSFAGQPQFVPVDLALIKAVYVADFPHFHSHGTYSDAANDPLSVHIFNVDGPKWRDVRSKLSPTFTSGKMKTMHETLLKCSEGLTGALERLDDPIEIKEIMARFTTDVIGSCAFGLDINSLENPDAEFRRFGAKIFEKSFRNIANFFLGIAVPHSILSFCGYSVTRRDVQRFFYGSLASTVAYRETNAVVRKDFLDFLVRLKNHEDAQERMSMDEIAAQCFMFFVAGFETSATTMNFACFELARHQDVQDKARTEIRRVLEKHDGKLTYDAVMEMTYLDMIIQESLRKYPPLPINIRKCTKTFKVPGESLEIKEGTFVMIPVWGIHYDPEYYPDPEVFDPERFSDENKRSRPAFSHLPFGEGPRICIGMRFGMHQTKIGLITLLNNYRIKLNSKTITPLKYDKILFTSNIGGIWLDLEKV
ncbi:unnamed protein product [Phyllotreta striolata]|uniref:Cytochrome P450 n=1 Tax=Phyllotreta striolata TaxID=444603 RepID=A0A9N9TMI8_PHYSR|nr:unnamed protein product [Phyllotreta striolata]